LVEPAEDNRSDIAQVTAEREGRKHPIDAIGALGDILDRQDRSRGEGEPSARGHGEK
jgi:hypothetical protein